MNRFKNNQSISHFIDQLVRYYKVPVSSSKKDVLDAVLKKIDEQDKHKINKRSKVLQITVSGITAAAVVAIAVIFWFTATVNISSGIGEVLTCRLPDESRVVLQGNSHLEYRKFDWNRKVKLQGEAYFEVQKGEGFQVTTKLGHVEVLGTRFLVSDQRKQLSVQCFEGKVKTTFNNKIWILEPYTQFTGENETTQKEEFEAEKSFPAFAKFQQSFSNENLVNVKKEIERFFNVTVELKNGQNRNFSGTIQTGSLENTLEILCESLQLNFKVIENNKVVIFK